MLRVCAGDIELNPRPNERHTRQTSLTPQAVEPKLADLDVPSSSVPKKYDGTSNMAEFRSSSPTPLQAVLEPRI